MNQSVKTPKVDVIWRERQDLADLSSEFVYPEFQRKHDREHSFKIAHAIMQNKFFNIIITVYKEGNKFNVIDGQHRIEALKICWGQFNLKTYSLIIVVLPEEEARMAFRRNNLGKKLQIADMLNSMKDINPGFFARMRKYVDTYRNQSRIGYGDLFGAFVFLENRKGTVEITMMEELLPKIREDHIRAMETLMEVLTRIEKHPNHNPIYRAPSFRSLLRITFEKKLTDRQISKCVAFIRSSEKLLDLTRHSSRDNILEFYNTLLSKRQVWF